MPANSVPLPTRRERCAPTSPSRLRRLGPGVEGRRLRQHGQVDVGQHHRSPAEARPRAGERHLLAAQRRGVPSGWRPRRPRGRPSRTRRADGAPQRRQHDVRRALQHPGDVLHPVERLGGQGAHRALALVQAQHAQVGGQPRRGARVAQQPQQRGHQEGRDQHHQDGRAEGDRAHQPGRRDRAGAGQGRGGPPAGHRRPSARSGARSRVWGVGTVDSTESTTPGPDAAVIHSSGRTVTRCPSTARATDFTSSGTT